MRASSVSRDRIRRRRFLQLSSLTVAVALAGCSAPGGAPSTSSTSATSVSVATTLPSTPVVLDFYLESGFTTAFDALQAEFTKQFPQVTFNVKSDTFQNLAQNATKIIASPDAPDLFRYPTVAAAAKDGILTNLDPYAAAYGWDSWPQGTLDQVRVEPDGSRGSGSLYALGIGYNTTGIYYNKALAAQVGMTTPPATLADLEELMAKAKSAGVLPSMLGNKGFTASFPLQMVLNQLDGLDQVKGWIYQEPGATFDTPSAVEASTKVQEWANAGYFPDDLNAIDYPSMVARFTKGEGLLMFNGDWEAGGITKNAPGEFGFFLFPGLEASSKHVAMAAPATYVIPATAKHKDETAFFLNWVHTNPIARQLVLDNTGASPGGPADLPQPTAPAGSVIEETLAAADQITKDDGAIDFLGNATPGILTSSIGPNSQLLVTNRMTPEEFVKAVQKDYETELGR